MRHTNALGACANCGALSSPCWRRGPEYARHLCNACGSRYLVKGTLEGYRPGQKNGSGGRRGKGKGRRVPLKRSCGSQSPLPSSTRLFNESGSETLMVDKAVQVDPEELQQMAPLVRVLPHSSATEVPPSQSSAPDSPVVVKHESSPESLPYAGDSKAHDASLQNADSQTLLEQPVFTRRRPRKPARPVNSGR